MTTNVSDPDSLHVVVLDVQTSDERRTQVLSVHRSKTNNVKSEQKKLENIRQKFMSLGFNDAKAANAKPLDLPPGAPDMPVPGFREVLGNVRRKADGAKVEQPQDDKPESPFGAQRQPPRESKRRPNGSGGGGGGDDDPNPESSRRDVGNDMDPEMRARMAMNARNFSFNDSHKPQQVSASERREAIQQARAQALAQESSRKKT